MAINLQSPGVQIIEKDASAVAPGASTTVGATAGVFQWGPVMDPQLIGSEAQLVSTFGKPDDSTFGSFFAAANFLAYTNAIWVTRVATTNLNGNLSGTGSLIKNMTDYEALGTISSTAGVNTFSARYPGTLGNGILVSFADSSTFASWTYASNFKSAPGTSDYAASVGSSNDELHIVVVDRDGKFSGTAGTILEKYEFVSKCGNAIGYDGLNNYYVNVIKNRSQYVYVVGQPLNTTNWGSTTSNTAFSSLGVATTAGSTTGSVATLTVGTTAFRVGSSVTVTGVTPVAYNGTFTVTASTPTTVSYAIASGTGAVTVQGKVGQDGGLLSGGTDANTATDAQIEAGFALYQDQETYDISLVVTGNVNSNIGKWVVDNLAETRKDLVAFVSLVQVSAADSVAPIIYGTSSTISTDELAYKTAIGNSTYTVIDSGYKYMYDRYNDKYRWVALNADTAGLCAKVDANQDTWFSPAGYTKGQIKNVVKLAYNPKQSQRDELYKLSINPVVTMAGQGTILFGDKTATLKPSAFDRINVRRLFLVLEKTISRAAKYQLFELNDSITRLQFVAAIDPFLRDVQGRRGIDAYKVICDETNNTPQVVATNEFRGTVLVKPIYSINFITLTFTAVGANVSFEVAAGV